MALTGGFGLFRGIRVSGLGVRDGHFFSSILFPQFTAIGMRTFQQKWMILFLFDTPSIRTQSNGKQNDLMRIGKTMKNFPNKKKKHIKQEKKKKGKKRKRKIIRIHEKLCEKNRMMEMKNHKNRLHTQRIIRHRSGPDTRTTTASLRASTSSSWLCRKRMTNNSIALLRDGQNE